VPESWEKGKKPVALPNPELNPLQNATLGRNLGRWAQVYFTSPPEKREEAVGELLRELRAETDVEPGIGEASAVSPFAIPRLICKFCQQPNDLDQSFCGLCGSPLRAPAPGRQQASAVSRAEAEAPAPTRVNILPAEEPREEDDHLEWLREKSLGRLAEYDEPSGKWKYLLAAAVVLVGTFGGLEWLAGRPRIANQPAASPQAAPPQAGPVAPAEPSTPASAPSARPASPAGESAAVSEPRVVPPEQVPSPAKPRRVPTQAVTPPAESPATKEGGAEELYLAQGYLGGKHGRRDSLEAAKYLWKAVAKQNSTAGVLLSDLYRSGDGVAKSCDQARLLLVAATQKGAPGAAEKLRSLESGGCR